MEEGIDYVVCPICRAQLRRLGGGHIQRIHKITAQEFRERYPNSLLSCTGYKQNISKTVKGLWDSGRYDHISNAVAQHWEDGTYNTHSEKVKQAHSDGRYNHIYTEERSRKISEAQKGIPKSEEHKAKIAKAHKDGRYDHTPKKISKSVSRRWDEGNYDHVDWSEVQLKPETVMLKSQAISKLHEEGHYDHIYNQEVRQKQSEIRRQAWEDGKYDGVFKSPSGLELAFAEALNSIGISYKQQYRIGSYLVDFLIGSNLVVELNGNYWHGSEEAREYDKERNDWIRSQEYNVIVIWEHEFYEDPNKCINKVLGNKREEYAPRTILLF